MSLISSTFGTIDGKISEAFSMFPTAHNFIFSVVIQYWDDATYAPQYLVYYSILASLVMCFAGSAYVVYKTVTAGISTTNGFYFQYADYS